MGTVGGRLSPRGWDRATETMLDMAGVGPGSRVLDVAAGAGEQTLGQLNPKSLGVLLVT